MKLTTTPEMTTAEYRLIGQLNYYLDALNKAVAMKRKAAEMLKTDLTGKERDYYFKRYDENTENVYHYSTICMDFGWCMKVDIEVNPETGEFEFCPIEK